MSNIQWLNKAHAAKLLKWSPQRFHYYYKSKRIPGMKMMGLTPIFNQAILEKWEPEDERIGNGKSKYAD